MKLLNFPSDAYLVEKSATSLFDGTMVASPTIGLWPSGVTGRCKVTISSVAGHTDVAGTLTVGGETLTFSQAGTKLTTVNLTAKPTVTSSGLDCHCHIAVIDTGGADVMTETLTALKVRYEPTLATIKDPSGNFTTYSGYFMVRDSSIVLGNVIRYNSTDYVLKRIEPMVLLNGTELYSILYF